MVRHALYVPGNVGMLLRVKQEHLQTQKLFTLLIFKINTFPEIVALKYKLNIGNNCEQIQLITIHVACCELSQDCRNFSLKRHLYSMLLAEVVVNAWSLLSKICRNLSETSSFTPSNVNVK